MVPHPSPLLLCLFLITLSGLSYTVDAEERDNQRMELREFLFKHEFKPIRSEPFEISKKYILGQALFFDPVLSTNNDISCATCHLFGKGTSDGLSKSIGTGGSGLGNNRQINNIEERHGRNSQALWNRDDNAVRSLFWDGSIEVLDPKKRIFRTPLNDLLPKSIQNALAAQSLFPLVNAGEMFAHNCVREEKGCLLNKDNYKTPIWIKSVHDEIINEILGNRDAKEENSLQNAYRKLFRSSYPDIPLSELDIGHVGNAIAHFEEVAFATRDARWDKYISGDERALSDNEVKGALIFYGKGRCSTCHRGSVFSDYSFHSLRVLSYKSKGQIDYGRYEVTGVEADKFKYRTPALRNVTITSPYMHDGSVKSLAAAILAHIDGDCRAESGLEIYCSSVPLPDVLRSIDDLSDNEKEDLIRFLYTLEDDASSYMEYIIPRMVPSGLPVHKDQ